MMEFIDKGSDAILVYFNRGLEEGVVSKDDILLVWASKTLQNKKAIMAVKGYPVLFEVTYNGDKDETYLDIYEKQENIVVKGDGQ